MADPPPFDPQRVFGELVNLLRRLDPSVESATVVYRGVGKGVLPVPLDAVPAAEPGTAAPLAVELNEFQRRVVRHFAALAANARLRGNLLTEAVRDDESDSTARRHLAELVKLEVLNNPRDMDGYGRGPAFASALKSVGG